MRRCTTQTLEIGMLKAALAGAMLATTGITSCLAQDYRNAGYEQSQPAQHGPLVTAGHIAQLRAALKLTAEQQKYWPALASALRGLSGGESGRGLRQRASAAVANVAAMRRVVSAARPLISHLTDQQKQAGMHVINSLGFSSLASAL
jgi:outer membrane lipoprotein SlyB